MTVGYKRLQWLVITLTILGTQTLSIAHAQTHWHNRAPVISGAPPTTVTMGSMYTFTPVASDPEGRLLTYMITNPPAWATFDRTNGRLQGTPHTAGTYTNVTIGVSDGRRTAWLAPFNIAVTAAAGNSAPTISGTPPTSASPGVQYAFQPKAADPNGDPLTFTIANRPAWATFNASTGALVGTPTTTSVGGTNIIISVSDGKLSASLPAFAITVASGGSSNTPPTISGAPATSVTPGTQYAFQPTAADVNGDPLTFSIVNKPAWATFTASTGRLQGTPGAADVGTTSAIVIAVSDGKVSTALAAFAVTVRAATTTGSATLSWQPPTQNTDGSALANLAGYKVYWGNAQGTYPNSVTLSNPGLATYVVGNLVSGTYFFVVTSFNATGAESSRSNSASKTIP